jgi:uracil-DNA glycosylase family 4
MDCDRKLALWNKFVDEAKACRSCPLAETRHKVVTHRGNPFQASCCFVVEAPGEEEDLRGKVLVGPSGHLFDRFIEDCGIQKDDWIAINTLNCRPPDNDYPDADIAAICVHKYLWVKLDIIEPKIVIVMGAKAANALLFDFSLGKANKMKSLSGQVFEPNPTWNAPYLKRLYVTYHPAFALRQKSGMPMIRSHLRFFMANAQHQGWIQRGEFHNI